MTYRYRLGMLVIIAALAIPSLTFAIPDTPPAGTEAIATAPAAMTTAQPAPAPATRPPDDEPVLPSAGWLLIGFALERALTGVIRLLRIVAPRTSTTLDDRALATLSRIDDVARELLGIVKSGPMAVQPSPGQVPSEPAPGPPGPRSLKLGSVLAVVALAAAAAAQPACSGPQRAEAGRAVIACARADALAIAALLATWGIQSATARRIDWQAIEVAAWEHGAIIGGCAVDRFVAATKPRAAASVLPEQPSEGDAVLDRLRHRWGGVAWQAAP